MSGHLSSLAEKAWLKKQGFGPVSSMQAVVSAKMAAGKVSENHADAFLAARNVGVLKSVGNPVWT